MKLQKIDGNVLTLMLALAFFNFIFLGTEYQFDNMAALVTGPEQVVTAQGYVLGASVLGFLLYPAMASYRKIKEKLRQIPKWEGDDIFLALLDQRVPFFSLKLCYQGDALTEAVLNQKRLPIRADLQDGQG